jgi:polysaccharide pyruvyl transferase WcaK-like protein
MLIFHGMLRSQNFGDTLMAQIVLDWIRDMTDEPIRAMFVSPPLRERLELPVASPLDILRAKAAVLSGGGYFQIADNGVPALKRFVKNAGPILLAQAAGSPSALIGIGVGPVPAGALESGVRRLLARAKVVCVRDRTGYDLVRRLVLGANVEETADIVFSLQAAALPAAAVAAADRIAPARGARRQSAVLFSDTPDRNVKYAPVFEALEAACAANPDRHVLLFEDHVNPGSGQQRAQALLCERLGPERTTIVPYPGTFELAALIARMDSVLTDKLHVGLVAAAMGVSPFSIAKHPKNLAAYAAINCAGNCLMIGEADATQYTNLALRALGISEPIELANEVRRRSLANKVHLSEFLRTCGLAARASADQTECEPVQPARSVS